MSWPWAENRSLVRQLVGGQLSARDRRVPRMFGPGTKTRRYGKEWGGSGDRWQVIAMVESEAEAAVGVFETRAVQADRRCARPGVAAAAGELVSPGLAFQPGVTGSVELRDLLGGHVDRPGTHRSGSVDARPGRPQCGEPALAVRRR